MRKTSKKREPRVAKTNKKKGGGPLEVAYRKFGCDAITIFRKAYKHVHGVLNNDQVNRDYKAWRRSGSIKGYVHRFLRYLESIGASMLPA